MTIYPNYYKNFSCIADKCKHSCCIGWEIDIDNDTLKYYDGLDGDMGEIVRSRICRDGEPHFCLADGERCPFLNENNLCELILNLGNDSLCYICSEHPRFKNQLGDRLELGLGLCCEEAGRIILGQSENFCLESDGDTDTDDEIIKLRDRAIEIVQRRDGDIDKRCQKMLDEVGFDGILTSEEHMLKVLSGLDALDPEWTCFVCSVISARGGRKISFSEYIKQYEKMYENLIIYFLYRYMANGEDLYDAALRAAFAVSAYRVVLAMSEYIYNEKGSFEPSDMVELCRRFSSEVEYNLDNLWTYMEECYEYRG